MNELRCAQEKKALEFLSVMGAAKFFSDVVKNGEGKLAEFFAAFYKYPNLEGYIKRFEEEKKALVYYVTQESFPWGECFSLLYVSQYEEDWQYQKPRVTEENQYIASAWVWNVTDDTCSEFGSVLLVKSYGCLVRVG